MSKQSQAQIAQCYDPKPDPSTCGFCQHFTSEKLLPAWMERDNAEGKKPWRGAGVHQRKIFTVEEDGVEKNLRCGIGGFAVKKLATCDLFARKPK